MKGGFLMARGAWMRANRLAANPHETVIWRDHDQRKNRELRRKTGWKWADVWPLPQSVAHATALKPRKHWGETQKEKDLSKSGPLMLVPVVGFELTTYRLQGGCSTN
jgi:hypothetical protein